MKIVNITPIGRREVYDLSIQTEDYDEQHYILENGVVTHNTGIYYSADTIWILGRQQDKDADGINGYHFIINIEKSRFVKEKSKIPITVSFEGGIQKWSGLLDIALELGYVGKPAKGWYQQIDPETGELMGDKMREADITSNKQFWLTLFEETDFAARIKEKYSLTTRQLIDEDEPLDEEV